LKEVLGMKKRVLALALTLLVATGVWVTTAPTAYADATSGPADIVPFFDDDETDPSRSPTGN